MHQLRVLALLLCYFHTVAQPLKAEDIVGTWSGILLPIGANESIDWQKLRDEVDTLLASGVDGIYTSGTAEELWTLSDDEFSMLGNIIAEKARSRNASFQIGASHPSPQVMRKRVLEALTWQPGAIQVILPDYYPVSSAEAQRFLADIAELAAPTGIVLYNPANAKRVLAPTEFAPLAKFLVGLKLVDKDRSWFSAMRECCGNLSLAVTGHHLASAHIFGAKASYSNVAALSPCGAAWWFHHLIAPGAQNAEKLHASLELEERIGKFFEEFVVPFAAAGYSDMALDKLLAEIGGWAKVGTQLRWPYSSIPQENADRLRQVARTRLPELFACMDFEKVQV